jgi:high-affinity K+ transport system ATPase subunit B
MATYSGAPQPVLTLVALLVCLIPTTIGALLSAIGIAGMDRLVQRNVLAKSGRAVEAAGDVSTLLLDKTGTITFGNRHASEIIPRRHPPQGHRQAGIRERFAELRRMGIRTVMITGDNPLTAPPSPPRPASTTSWPRPRPRTSWR